jgi:hypothetical protein
MDRQRGWTRKHMYRYAAIDIVDGQVFGKTGRRTGRKLNSGQAGS